MPCFDSLPNQSATRHTIHGLRFNLIVVGPTGIGKTTLINSLFDFDSGDSPDYCRGLNSVELKVKEFRPQHETIDMKLTIIETKGFNNRLDRSEIYRPIVDYIDARYEDYLRHESKVPETKYDDIADSRVHCCIYMISPTARGLKPIDLVTMKMLHERVCLIPVIGRSDQLTLQERQTIKRSIMKEICDAGIQIYQDHNHNLPFAVAASDEFVEEDGKRLRARSFPWGRMYIERDSDFPQLRDLLLRSNMLSLIDLTNRMHYKKYKDDVTRKLMDVMELNREKISLDKKVLIRN